jgi:serine/threonine protein kinase
LLALQYLARASSSAFTVCPHHLSLDLMVCIILADGSRVDSADLVGNGADGFVIRHGDHVMKIPNLRGHLQPNGEIEAHVDNELYRETLEVEKEVYKRLRNVPGVAECLECTNNGIRLRYYPNGSLHELVSGYGPPPISWRWRWALQATDVIARCHERGVLVLDIALRNFLLTDEFDLRIIDFANSSLVSREEDITKVNINGVTASLDLLYLSAAIYSILTWQDFAVHCFDESEWPSADTMPDLTGLAFGSVIQKCWLRKYTCIQDLACELRQCVAVPPTEPLNHRALVFAPPEVNVRSSSSASPSGRDRLGTTKKAHLSTNPPT